MNLLGTIVLIFTAGPIFVLSFIAAVAGMGLHALPSFLDPDFYAEMFEYISSIDLGEMLEIAKEGILIHIEMY